MDCLCHMWFSEPKGELSDTPERLSRMLGIAENQLSGFLTEAEALGFASVTCNANVTLGNKNVTVRNRRMYCEAKALEQTRLRVQKHREKKACNTDVTVPSSSSSSASASKSFESTIVDSASTPRERGSQQQEKKEEEKKPKKTPEEKQDDHIWGKPRYKVQFDSRRSEWLGISEDMKAKWKKAFPAVDIDLQLDRAAVWMAANPAKRKDNYQRFLNNWLSSRQEKGGDRGGTESPQQFTQRRKNREFADPSDYTGRNLELPDGEWFEANEREDTPNDS